MVQKSTKTYDNLLQCVHNKHTSNINTFEYYVLTILIKK